MTFLIYVLIVSAFSVAGSWYAKKYNSYDLLYGIYITFCLITQIIASKIATFDIFGYKFTAPAAMLIFGVTFLLTDVVNEKFGRKAVHKMILITFVTQVFMSFFLLFATKIEPAPYWNGQESWNSIFGLVPRILIASWITFLVSENLDAYLFEIVRKFTKGKHLWARNVFSTIPSLTVDTLIFVTIAFYGTGLPILEIMTGQFVTKYFVGIINIPFMYLNKSILGKTAYDI